MDAAFTGGIVEASECTDIQANSKKITDDHIIMYNMYVGLNHKCVLPERMMLVLMNEILKAESVNI